MTITQSSSAPLVAVVGATGVQASGNAFWTGGSVIKALAESDAPYRIRGFTRDITKAASEALIKQGVEMIAISLVVDNVEEVNRVFAGVNYAFLVTNYWEHVNMEKEVSEGKMLIDAAKAAGVERLVWSGLVSPLKISSGKYTNVNHFDGKAEVTEYARQSGVPFVNVQAGLYATNFLGNPTMLAKQPDGTFAIAWAVKPTTVIPIIDAANDYGLFVRRVFELPVFPAGSEVYTSSEDITIEELARQLSEVTGKTVVFKQLTTEEWAKNMAALGTPSFVFTKIIEGFQFFDEFGYYGGNTTASREGLGRPTRTWVESVKEMDWSKTLA